MMNHRDSVRRAAEAFLPEDLGASKHLSSESPLVICGYTGEFLEEVLRPVSESVTANNAAGTTLFPVAA